MKSTKPVKCPLKNWSNLPRDSPEVEEDWMEVEAMETAELVSEMAPPSDVAMHSVKDIFLFNNKDSFLFHLVKTCK